MRVLKQNFALLGIALSGYGMEADIAESRAAGFSEHPTKPVELTTLEDAIRRIVNATPLKCASGGLRCPGDDWFVVNHGDDALLRK